MKIGLLKSRLLYFSTCLILISSASFISKIILSVQAGARGTMEQWSWALLFPRDISDSRGFPTGDYYVEIMSSDTLGNWLDGRTYGFGLGRPLINVASFSVESNTLR